MTTLVRSIPYLLILAIAAFVLLTHGTAPAPAARGSCPFATYGPDCEFEDTELLDDLRELEDELMDPWYSR